MAQVSARARAAALGAVVALAVPGLVACSDDPPAASPPPSTSAGQTESPSPSGPPPLPAAAKGTTPQAAEAFVRYYVDLINYGLETLDSEPLRSRSSSECSLCSAFADALDTLKSRDGFYDGGRWTLKGIRQVDSAESVYVFEAEVRIGRERIVQRSPRAQSTHAKRSTAYIFRISHGPELEVVDLQGIVE